MEKQRKAIILSLAGLLIGSLLYIFNLSLSYDQLFFHTVYYILAVLIYCISAKVSYINYKENRKIIFVYILILSLVLLATISFTYLTALIK